MDTNEQAAEIAALKDKLAFYTENGQSEQPAAVHVRERINALETLRDAHAANVAAERAADEAAQKIREGGPRR